MARGGEGKTGEPMLDGVWKDLAFAARALARRPSFTVVAVVTLAIGIGANTTIFSVVNGVLLEPLPYPGSERMGILWHELGRGAQNLPALHPLDLRDYRERSEVFEDFTMVTGGEWILGADDDAELVDVGLVEAGFFEFFEARPVLGRAIQPAEDVPGAAPVVVLSHRLWTRRFGQDPGVVGSMVDLDGSRMEVVGVAPEWFRLHLPAEVLLLRDPEVWVSLRLDPADQPARNITVFTGIGRLRPGATFAQAQEELEVLEAELQAEHPEHAASNLQVRVVPFLKDVVKTAERDLLLLLGAVAFVLLIACANVANLLLERGRARARELAIRAALGSGRAGLVRLALAESALLALTGGALGLALAAGSLELLARLGSASVPRLDAVRIDGTVLSFVAAACALCTVLVGLLPALRASAGDPAEVLVADARSGGGPGQARFRDALVVLEVAASFVLLVGTGLMIRSFLALGSVDPGYDPRDLLTFRLALPSTSFPEWGSRQALHEELLGALEALPGVQGAATVDQLPLTGTGILQPYAYDEETALDWESVTADRRWVSPGFFETMGARLLEGRAFTSEDAGLWRVIIDDRLAERAFPGRSAVGERLQVRPNGSEDPYADVVGVVSHLNLLELGRAHLPQIYTVDPGLPQASVLVRVTGDPERLVPSVRRITARLAPGAPVEDVRTMEEVVRAALAPARLALVLMALFGAGALLLACVGIYGVLSNAVSSRTREIGIRLALGRSPARVRADVLGEGMRLVAVALVLGFVAALVLSRALRASLYGVGPWDPATYAGVGLVLAAVAALACWSPARRATSVDPAETLRTE